jgi:DNA-directed RNA polymerase specialized sigma24 family protein
MEELVKYVRALVHLQVATMYPMDPPEKAEIILSRAGLTHAEIAALLGKKPTAVSKAISRAK